MEYPHKSRVQLFKSWKQHLAKFGKKGLPPLHPCGETLPRTLVIGDAIVHRVALYPNESSGEILLPID